MNNKVTVISIVLSIVYTHLTAQSWNLGVEGGPSWSRLNAESVENEKNRFGYQVRFWLNKPLGTNTSLESGLQFITMGAINERSFLQNPNSRVRWEYNLSYINIPLEFRYSPHHNITFGSGIYAGLLSGFNVNREASFSNSITTPDRSNLKSHDLGYLIRVSFSFYPISIGLNYQHSFVELPNSPLAEELIQGARNSAIQIFIGYTLFKTK